ncbi:FRAS1-related extracellular matrix protein 2 [Labeo rohita]|uniref:FRAS1-related extracellular matrix protein 2 n=1 Tax=Labeo rohita TaxID=84645 RepID=A0ABQ8LHQ9_LABRO|nr:FRAS1-related extracellular matrix protein 2 [Labeo rohita]
MQRRALPTTLPLLPHPLTPPQPRHVCLLKGPSAHLQPTICAGLPVSIGIMAGGSPVSTSSLRVQNSALAPGSLVSTVARQPTSSTGLPCPSGSALVSRRPAIASGHFRQRLVAPSHRLHWAPPSLTLSLPSVRWACHESASFHRRCGWRIPCLRLQPPSPELCLGPPTQWLCPSS